MVPFTGVTLKITPPQAVAVIGDTVASALRVTTTLNEAPLPQLTVVGVTV